MTDDKHGVLKEFVRFEGVKARTYRSMFLGVPFSEETAAGKQYPQSDKRV